MKILFVSSGNRVKKEIISHNQAESLRSLGLTVTEFLIIGRGLWGYLKNIFILRSYLNKNKFDILHAHFGLSGLVVYFAKRKQKLLVSFMGDDILGSKKRDGQIKFFSKLLTLINIFMANNFYNYIIVKSQEMKNQISNPNVQIIPNGVNFNQFTIIDKHTAREILSIDKKKVLIIFVADPTRPEKNYLLAENSVKLIDKDDIELKTIYQLKQEELNLYYNAADILIMTSFHEGSPNVIKEAMASNCPIVATNVGDIRWVIGETEGCYLTDFNVNDVVAKIEDALNFVSKKVRTNGRERIKKIGLDAVTISERIYEIYRGLLS